MRNAVSHTVPDERGFILVGVVMFMLALTILGLSLFALSSYEAQFFVASAAREQSLQNSESGMELVKALLARNSTLEAAHLAEGQMGITSALAYQQRSGSATDTTSTGPVDWNSKMVIVVAARSGGVERTLQARFVPTPVENPYQRLLAAGAGITLDTENSSDPSVLEFSGRAWQPVSSDADTAWTGNVTWRTGGPVERGSPPIPLADGFVDQAMSSGPQDPTPACQLSDRYDYDIKFLGSTSKATFFTSPSSPTLAGENSGYQLNDYNAYTFYAGADLDVDVRGIAVWVLPKGVCFKDQVSFDLEDSTIPSTLVIVAKANGSDPSNPNAGIWFKGGLRLKSSNLQVYLVSQGDVSVIQHNDADQDHDARAVSIVAGGRITIGGPNDYHLFRLGYDASSMDALADQLLSIGALPWVPGGAGKNLVAERQTWVETTPR